MLTVRLALLKESASAPEQTLCSYIVNKQWFVLLV